MRNTLTIQKIVTLALKTYTFISHNPHFDALGKGQVEINLEDQHVIGSHGGVCNFQLYLTSLRGGGVVCRDRVTRVLGGIISYGSMRKWELEVTTNWRWLHGAMHANGFIIDISARLFSTLTSIVFNFVVCWSSVCGQFVLCWYNVW